MDRIDAHTVSAQSLQMSLVSAEAPVVVTNAIPKWRENSERCWDYTGLLGAHASLPIKVIVDGGRYRGEPTTEQEMPLSEFTPAM